MPLCALLTWFPQDAAASIPRGTYGGLQGLGGLEAVIGSDGATRGIVSDWFGNAVGFVAAPGAAMTWSSAQFLAWGPAPGWSTQPLDGTKPLHELLGYRGLTVDPPGYVQQGLCPYDPQTGRWLSPDPVGHSGSLSLYDYCDNDPLNVFDPDGRFGKAVASYVYSGGAVSRGFSSLSSGFDSLGNYGVNRGNSFVAGIGGGGQSLFGSFASMSSPQSIVNSTVGSYNANLSMFGGSHYSAINATLNPAYHAMTGFYEAGTGTGVSFHNLGQSLSGSERTGSFFQGVSAAAGTASVSLGGAAIYRVGMTSMAAAKTTQIIPVGEVGVLRQGSFVNRVYDSRFGQSGVQVSGPLGRSFTPGSGVPTTAGEAIQQRGLNLFHPNNAERAVIYRATGDIPTINRTSIGGSAPETLIDPRYFDRLEKVREFSLPR